MNESIKKKLLLFRRIASTFVIIILVLEITVLAAPYVLGYKSFSVLTSSMKPTLSYGTLVFVKQIQFDEVAINDIATFESTKDASKYFTHRIVGIDTDNKSFVTKGDANPTDDPLPTGYSQMVGKVVTVVPFAGLIAAALKSSITLIVTIALLIVWLAFEIELFAVKKKQGEKQND